MTKDEIMRMARESGMPDPVIFIGAYERFSALLEARAAAAEREACAKLCDNEKPANPWKPVSAHLEGQFEMAGHLAELIRARGNQ